VSPSGKTIRRTPNVLELQERLDVLYRTSEFGGAWTSPAKTLSFLSVCVSGVSAYDFAMNLLEYRNGFDTVGWFAVVHPRSTFSVRRQSL